MTNLAEILSLDIENQICVSRHADYVAIFGEGLWSPGYADSHFAELERVLIQVRGAARGARVLVDLSGALVQPVATAERISFWTARLYRETDRVAIVVASSLAKAQMRRSANIACRELFLSRNAALTWLLADVPSH